MAFRYDSEGIKSPDWLFLHEKKAGKSDVFFQQISRKLVCYIMSTHNANISILYKSRTNQ